LYLLFYRIGAVFKIWWVFRGALIFKVLIPLMFIFLVLNSFNLFDKFSFDFLKDSLLFNKKLEIKENRDTK